jgi:hypothetical protein
VLLHCKGIPTTAAVMPLSEICIARVKQCCGTSLVDIDKVCTNFAQRYNITYTCFETDVCVIKFVCGTAPRTVQLQGFVDTYAKMLQPRMRNGVHYPLFAGAWPGDLAAQFLTALSTGLGWEKQPDDAAWKRQVADAFPRHVISCYPNLNRHSQRYLVRRYILK